MKRIRSRLTVAGVAALAAGAGFAPNAWAANTAHLNMSTLVLSGGDQYHYPTITVSGCALAAPVLAPVLSSSNSNVDYIDWPGSGSPKAVRTGNKANWEVFAFDYVPGRTYHLNDPDEYCNSNLDTASVTGQFNVKLATGSTFLSVSRKNGWVTATGTTRQFERSANYGSGGWVRHSEAVTVQYQKGTGWYAVKKFTSAGSFKVTYRGTVTRNYRLLIPSTSTLQQSLSSVKRA